ncbi:MAG: LLM class flavin-dependent oxidoreductase [Chloroflexota bacterium]|nr:LLM class flavin-dependent oxidoreductase [Chloroflexota bacterium]
MAVLRAGLVIRRPDPAATLAAIARAEEVGVPAVWSTVGGTNPDAVTLFAAAAARTTRIGLGTAIVPTYPRHPIVLASQALVLAALAPGRLRLGIGPSHRPTIEGMFGLPMGKPLRPRP